MGFYGPCTARRKEAGGSPGLALWVALGATIYRKKSPPLKPCAIATSFAPLEESVVHFCDL